MGVVQSYYAVRVQLDASLLQLLLREHLQGDAAAARVDAALHPAGLRRRAAQAPRRGWDARGIGMRRLLVCQNVATLLQCSVLLLAVLWPQTGAIHVVTGARALWIGCAPSSEHRVYYGNHASHGDFVLIWSSMPPALRRQVRPVAAAEYWQGDALRRYLIDAVYCAKRSMKGVR
ncbi:hypothetical protein G6F59_015693 [Rhizopus arrhizus]|nr:hypothetical protein G6F59_015693 [Rhizopus arrhizus]